MLYNILILITYNRKTKFEYYLSFFWNNNILLHNDDDDNNDDDDDFRMVGQIYLFIIILFSND
jgi:hypothetical protein